MLKKPNSQSLQREYRDFLAYKSGVKSLAVAVSVVDNNTASLYNVQEMIKLIKSFETIYTLPQNDKRIFIDIPFNAWETFKKKGNIAVKGTINAVPYKCGLLPRGNGAYSLSFTKEMQKNTGAKLGDKLTITMAIDDTPKAEKQIDVSEAKKINDIELVMQPNPKACGQACIAMLANVSCKEVIKVMHTSGTTSIGQLIEALNFYNINHAEKNIRLSKNNPQIPSFCILTVRMPTYPHWVLYYKGKFYDPEFGLLENCHPEGKITSFLEIYC